ncbi:MAG: sulfite exporter TauE/SafE family protein [Ilumatobacteraceae bacterium]
MFTLGALLIGAAAAFVVGLSKTGLPGGALIAVPMLAVVFDGRLITGATLPILIVADLFAVGWYRSHARWDVLQAIAPWIAVGYGFGIAFFLAIGAANGVLETTIGVIVLVIVALQVWRMWRGGLAPVEPTTSGRSAAGPHGTIGGFTTFVANAAGPVINTYLIRLGLPKHELIGTSAWLYFVVNLSKIPLYIALGAWSTGGAFFTVDSLLFDLAMVPAIVAGVFGGRALFVHIPQRAFAVVVLSLSAAGAVKLLL